MGFYVLEARCTHQASGAREEALFSFVSRGVRSQSRGGGWARLRGAQCHGCCSASSHPGQCSCLLLPFLQF